MSEYTLQINLEPEFINNTFLYFWCIIKNDSMDSASNYGFGWAATVNGACEEAYNYFKKFIVK